MDTILAAKTTSISEFKSNPAAALKNAGDEPFAVLTNNKPSFYVVQPELYESLVELLFDSQITPVVKKRLARIKKAIPVKLSDL
jgi:antitoxin StbD